MKECKLKIRIQKPVSQVFVFTINPQNTPKWIDSIVCEKTNEWPTKKGTRYKNQNGKGEWSEYTMADFKENEMFVMDKSDNNYHVKYIFKPIDKDITERITPRTKVRGFLTLVP